MNNQTESADNNKENHFAMKMQLKENFNRLFPGAKPLQPCFHTSIIETDDGKKHRFHLRLEDNGTGLLIINAHTVLHLNQSAAEYVFHIINKSSLDEVTRMITSRYQINSRQALFDFLELKEQIFTLIQRRDLAPDVFLSMDRVDPYPTNLTAPYRLDCALTYQLESEDNSSFSPQRRVTRELTTEEWMVIFSKAWEAGIPHIIFTGGEPTLRPDLFNLVSGCQSLGLVTGLLTNGLIFSNQIYLEKLLSVGLDHIMLILDPGEEQTWKALKNILHEDIFLTVHLTLNGQISENLVEILEKLAKFGVSTISLSAQNNEDSEILKTASHIVAEKGMELKWDIPVPYSFINPVALESNGEMDPIIGAGVAWLYVEPDGDVLPFQSSKKVLGNLLSSNWQTIWQSR